MKIATRRAPSHTDNVIRRLPGELTERIVFCAHYDSKIDTPGAYDNAAGVGVLLTLAMLLSQGKHRYTLEFVAFTGEEGAGLGDMEYGRSTGNFDQGTTTINIDGVGPFTGTTTIATFAASQEFDARIEEMVCKFPGVVRVEPWPASDHYIFYSHGVPSIALTSKGISGIYHTQSDTLDWISPEKLAEATQLILYIFEELDTKDVSWSRPNE